MNLRLLIRSILIESNLAGNADLPLNSEGHPIARTQEEINDFYSWFGNSKVVDSKERPLVVYHGTNNEFDTFNAKGKGTVATFISSEIVDRTGIFFTSDKRFAGEFGTIVKETYLRMENPADLNNPTIELYDKLEAGGFNTRFFYTRPNTEYWEAFDGADSDLIVSALKSGGYDGVLMHEIDGNGKIRDVYVALSSDQVRTMRVM